MEKYLIALGVAVLVVGFSFSIYQFYQLVKTDAICRGLKHPKLWGFFAISGNNQAGLILYLIARRKHPVISMTDEQKSIIDRCKARIGVGLIFLVVGAIVCVWSMVLYQSGL